MANQANETAVNETVVFEHKAKTELGKQRELQQYERAQEKTVNKVAENILKQLENDKEIAKLNKRDARAEKKKVSERIKLHIKEAKIDSRTLSQAFKTAIEVIETDNVIIEALEKATNKSIYELRPRDIVTGFKLCYCNDDMKLSPLTKSKDGIYRKKLTWTASAVLDMFQRVILGITPKTLTTDSITFERCITTFGKAEIVAAELLEL